MQKFNSFFTILLFVFLQLLFSPIKAQTITERGLLKSVEDAGYPMFVVTIEFPERKFSEVFNLNMADIQYLDAGKLSSWQGKYVSFDYTSDFYNMLEQLKVNGKNILDNGGVPPKSGGNVKVVTGILSNAAEETRGDLPDIVYVTTEEEISVPFEYFITPEIVAANGKKVTAYYEERTQNVISGIELIK